MIINALKRKLWFFLFVILLSLSFEKNGLGKIHFINTADTNAFLIESQGRFGLVDSSNNYLYSEHEVEKLVIDPSKGEKDHGAKNPAFSVQRVVDYLMELKVDKLDFIIATHAHNDHIGGIPAIAYYFVDEHTYYYYKAYKPTREDVKTDYANSAYFRAAYDSMKIKKAQLIDVTDKKVSFKFGEFDIEILSTETRDCYDLGENCYSLTQLLTIGNNRIFLEGDLHDHEDKKIAGKIGLIDVFQVGHHGVDGSASYELIKVIRPKTAIIPNDCLDVRSEAKVAYMKNHFNTDTYVTIDAGDEIKTAAILVTFYEQGYDLETTAEKVDTTNFNGWKKWNELKCYLVNGQFLINWQKLEWTKGNDTFYFNDDGIMLTGWQKLDWKGGVQDIFYFDPKDGYMLHDTCKIIDGENYCFDENGVLIQ